MCVRVFLKNSPSRPIDLASLRDGVVLRQADYPPARRYLGVNRSNELTTSHRAYLVVYMLSSIRVTRAIRSCDKRDNVNCDLYRG